jgi:hypothetical protein
MSRIRRHLTYANVAATLALLIAIAGGTSAIAGSKAPKNSVVSSSIRSFNVTAKDIAGLRVVQASGQVSAFASCPPKARLLGGGGAADGPLGASRPGSNGWLAQQGSGPGDRLVVAYALCLRPKPGA